MERFNLTGRRAFVMVALVLVVFLLADFNSRLSNLQRLSAQQERNHAEVAAMLETQAGLETQIAYATSDAAVEEWAYEQGRYARDGDNVIVPLPGEVIPPTPPPVVSSTPEPVSNWEVWWAMFFGGEK
jgi:cell division protein FtsB